MTDSARNRLAELVDDPAYGARPLKRVLQERLLEPLSEKIISGEIREGSLVRCDLDGDGFAISARSGDSD